MEDSLSIAETPAEYAGSEMSAMDKQRATLQTYLDSLPYECESVDEMQAMLEIIVGKMAICAQTKNWLTLTTWDGMLQCWLLMRYPMATTTRAKLVRLHYELCLLPGIDPHITRSWADMLPRLLANKPRLEATDLELSWQPLWRVLQKELWPKKSVKDNNRNMVNILLFVAEQSNRYYPAGEIPNMLNTFLPLVTKDTILTMVPVMTSFLPPSHTHLYLPCLFKLWEAFNSTVLDDRLTEFSGMLSEEHVAAKFGIAGEEGGAEWKDIGMWTEAEWTLLVGKALGSINVPVEYTKVSGNTSSYADARADRDYQRIRKSINKYHAVAKIFVYSMAVDGPIRADNEPGKESSIPSVGYLAGSRALDSLDKLITSTESFFHPSNSGPWTLSLTTLLQRLTVEFSKRWAEEEESLCKTPVTHRLTPAIRRAFVTILRTPAFLAMFSKDPMYMGYAQAALRTMALLEPGLIMPELLSHAYSGLESINETHRTTAVLSMLSGVTRPLVSEEVWFGGQKNLVPLLELCLPGIDLNDPVKTICATMFVIAAVQNIKIGDLSGLPSSVVTDMMGIHDDTHINGHEGASHPSREEERGLVRESTAGFADWVTSLFRRVLALYENLPEEGGRKNTTGGKQEEEVLKSIKSMIDFVCLHLSDHLFDLVLNLVYNYATTNAKSNAVRAFGQLVACLARLKPERTMAMFLPFCIPQVQEELKHGASSARTTSTHAAVPSDTTLHWNMSILRGCLGHGGPALLKYKKDILALIKLLVEKTKSERGYSGTGSLITRVLHTLSGVYPLDSRFVNSAEWEDPAFDNDHNMQWGRLYEPSEVKLEWHVPSDDEIAFVLEILDQIAAPALDKVVSLLDTTAVWDNVSRNDFCRYLYTCKSVWYGLPTIFQESEKDVVTSCLDEKTEVEELIAQRLDVKAGFALTDPKDPRFQAVLKHRMRFGSTLQRAAFALRHNSNGEDHIDAVIAVTKAIDVFLLGHGGVTHSIFVSLRKNYAHLRDLNQQSSKQRKNSRMVFVMRAQVYHNSRVYMHALCRSRSGLDDGLLGELVELSLSPYTRVRCKAQTVLHSVCNYYVRSTAFILPALFDALAKGNDADRMKGALYVLWNRGTLSAALADEKFYGRYLLSLLECQHEEKPSVQKLVNSVSQDCLAWLSEESLHTGTYSLESDRLGDALQELEDEFSPAFVNQHLLTRTKAKTLVRVQQRSMIYNKTISSILELALRQKTHWRYVLMATKFLYGLLRRDISASPDLARFFMECSTSPQPTIRVEAQRAVVRLLAFVKMRTYAKSSEELWLDDWCNPLELSIPISNSAAFLEGLQQPIQVENGAYVDKIRTGFISWKHSVYGYRIVKDTPIISWEEGSRELLHAISEILKKDDYFEKLSLLWSQESTKNSGKVEIRLENAHFIKNLAKMFEDQVLDYILPVLDPLLSDSDRFKQRAGTEFLSGLLRGSKHWRRMPSDRLWKWAVSHIGRCFAQITPDTLSFWEKLLTYQLSNRDPRRSQPLVDWILALPLEFNGESAFAMSKTLSVFSILVGCLDVRFQSLSNKYLNIFFDAAKTGYAEVRTYIANNLYMITRTQWLPLYPSTELFLRACRDSVDPLRIRLVSYTGRIEEIVNQFPKLKDQRLPPPRANQSEYDRAGLTLLHWIWLSAYSAQTCLVLPCVVPMMPEILRMSELNDSSELQIYSSAVLYVLSAVSLPHCYIEVILGNFVSGIKSSESWRIRLHALPALVVFFYRNLMSISPDGVSQVMDVLLDCLADENIEVREMASKALSGIVRCSQRQSIVSLKNRFLAQAQKSSLPPRQHPGYADSLRLLHSAILGICALVDSFPYSVEPWMPPLTEVLALHATDPPPISTTIRKCASQFKKTHQDTWHNDQQAFDEDQLQSLSTMLVGTSYYA